MSPPLIRATLEQDLPPWQLRGSSLIIPWRGPVRVSELARKLDQAVVLADVVEPATR